MAQVTTMEEMKAAVTTLIRDRFPQGFVNVGISTLGGPKRPSLTVSFAARQREQWTNGIIHNEDTHTVFLVHCAADDNGIVQGCILDGSIYGLRDRQTYKTDKLGWRDIKKPGPFAAVEKNLAKYFDSLKAAYAAKG